jgi:excisionase family DNA binding protein
MARRFNYRRVKIHHSYTIGAAAKVLGAHKRTVSRWIAAGLPTTDAERPFLIRGEDLRAFMRTREPVKQRCQPGEAYCLGCRVPKRPAGNMADYIPRTVTRGLLSGICPTCGKMIYRATSLAKIEQIGGGLDVAFPKAEQRIGDSPDPLSNADFKQDEQE